MPPKAKRLTRKEKKKERDEEERRKAAETEEMLQLLGIGKKTQDEELFAGKEMKDWWKIFHAQSTLYQNRCKEDEVKEVEKILQYQLAIKDRTDICDFTCWKEYELYVVISADVYFIIHWTYQNKYRAIAGTLTLFPKLLYSLLVDEDMFGYYYRGTKAGLNADCKFIYGRQFLEEMDESLTAVTTFIRTKFEVFLEESGGIYLNSVSDENTYELFLEWLLQLDKLLSRAQKMWGMCELGAYAVDVTERTRQSYTAPHHTIFRKMMIACIDDIEFTLFDDLVMFFGRHYFVFAGGRTSVYTMTMAKGEKEGYDKLQLESKGLFDVDLDDFVKKSLEDPFAKCSFTDLPEFPN